jgi:hypothetical protein
MDQKSAIHQIRALCNQIASSVTSVHPLIPHLSDAPAQAEIFKTLYELTKQVEVVKKQLLKLEKRDLAPQL